MPSHRDNAQSLLAPETVANLVGVIDLKDGQAVHAIAGQRSRYQGVRYVNGDACLLAGHYRSLGLRRLYVADLDGIQGGSIQWSLVQSLLAAADWCQEVLLDVGWTGQSNTTFDQLIAHLQHSSLNYRLIAATETARSIRDLERLADQVSPTQLLIGLDYRGETFVSNDGDAAAWMQAAADLSIDGAVVLDVKSVGSGNNSSAIRCCQTVKQLAPTMKIYSGGGVRDARDVEALMNAGCQRVLVASALLNLK